MATAESNHIPQGPNDALLCCMQASDNVSADDTSGLPMSQSAPVGPTGTAKAESKGPFVTCTPTASIPIPNANARWAKSTIDSGCLASPTPGAVIPQPHSASFESVTSFMDMEGAFPCDDEPALPCSSTLMRAGTEQGPLVAPATCIPFGAQAVAGSAPALPAQHGGVVMQSDGVHNVHALECSQGISVQLPDVGGQHITASSSDEASPQLVHVLRRSETLQGEGGVFQDLESDVSGGHHDAEMRPIEIEGSCELRDDAILDDSWVTVDDVLEDASPYQSPSPSSFGQNFLRRHVYPTLRKMSPPQG